MTAKQSQVFIEQALVTVYSRGTRTITTIADELNINHHTLRCWITKHAVKTPLAVATKEKRPQDWTAEEQLVALQECHGLSGEALQARCRERGIFAHHLTSWRAAFCADTHHR